MKALLVVRKYYQMIVYQSSENIMRENKRKSSYMK